MRKLGMVLAGVTCLLVGLLLLGGSDAQGGGGGEKKGKKLDAARLKIILNKIDPEIRAAQKALARVKGDLKVAKNKLKAAIENEVFGEKGPTEGRVIDLLKAALKNTDRAITDINAAIREANIAQLVDKG
jgi:hypothetical protein